jgi:PAS domain S-box-containing protein
MWEVQDENGVMIVQELIAKARSGGGFVEYVMPKFKGLPSAPKLSYAEKIDDWQWYVGAGIYMDEINTVLDQKRAELRKHIRQHLIMIAFTLAGVVAITVIAVRLFTQRLRHTFESFTQFFEKASTEELKIDTSNFNFKEFENLAQSANRMVDDRLKSDQALKESLKWNQTIFNSIQSGIVLIDPETHKVVDANPAATELFGLPREAIIGRACHNFICPSQKGQCPILDLKKRVDHEERVLIRQDGTEIPILKSVSRADMGNRPYLIESFLDISEQKKLETQLQQAQKMEAIGTLTGGIAHDFNNILGVILGNTELAQLSMAASDEAYAKLEVTKEATFRAKKIVNQLLSFSRQTTAEKTAVDVNQLTKETINFVRALIPATIDIQQQILHEPCVIFGNPTQIHQVLINLCVNASHAVDDETGTIRLHVSKTEVGHGEFDHFPEIGGATFVEIIVSDNGHGIAPEIKDRIFEPYFTTKDVGKGTGMGLAVVMGIVQDHGGAIAIDSQPKQGTTVRVVLPLADLDSVAPDLTELQRYPSGNRENILIIDDEELLVELGKDLLERLNYRVEGYMDASAAIERFRANPQAFDLIISDMTMPKMSGSRIVEEARRIRSDIPVIICSGYSKNMDETRADELGCQYIKKPIDMKTLSETVRKILDKRSI